MQHITTSAAAAIIGCQRRHVVKLFHAGLIQGEWFGRVLQIDEASARAYRPERTGPRDGLAIERMQPYARRG